MAQQANFTADVTSGCFPLSVKFTDASTGSATGWSWDLGNGNQSTEQNPGAVYSAPGTYTVKLTITGPGISDTEIKNGYIVVYNKPTVNFSFDKTQGCSPLQVKFTDQSQAGSGAITAWSWAFGDGGTSTQANPTYIYQTSGTKNISLKVKNQYGCEVNWVNPSTIAVQGPNTNFTMNSTSFCQVPAAAQFTNQSTGDGPLTYAWDFGDGQPGSTQKDVSHTYSTAGTFTAKLTVKDKNGCSSIKTQQIRTGGEGGITVTPSKNKICTGESVSFTTTAETTVLSYDWNFGTNSIPGSSSDTPPPATYTQAGTYTVTLRAKLLGKSCESIVSFPIEVVAYPEPTFTYSVDCTQKVTFTSTSTGAATLRWEIDNSFASDQKTFTRQFPGPGSHTVRLIAYNSLNCSKTYDGVIDVNGKPTASFLPDKAQDCGDLSLSGCAPFTINFTNTSASATSFTSKWTFGDGQTSTDKNPTHTYGVGTYTVTLEVKNTNGCTSTKSAQVVVSNITPVAKFIVSKNTACAHEDLQFTDQSTNATFWCWDFGDGGTSSMPSPSHSYNEPGVYTVTLIVKNGGCTSTYTITDAVTVKDPFVDFEIKKNCGNPFQIQLVNKSRNYNSLTWTFGDNQTATGAINTHLYTATGDYSVVLIGTNTASQCSVRVEKPVSIYDVKADFTVDNLRPCKNSPVTFTDKSQGASAWFWIFDNGLTSGQQNPTTSYSIAGPATATLSAIDPDGCSKSKSVVIDVIDITGNFNTLGTSNCEEFNVKFTDLTIANPSITAWEWNFGDATALSTDQHPLHTYEQPGKYTVSVSLTNSDGLTCTLVRNDAINFTVPVADFTVDRQGHCLEEFMQFGNLSRNAATYSWDFGDGQTAGGINPIIAYHAIDTFTVTLKARDTYGCEKTRTRTDYIFITKPKAGFSAKDIYSDCPPLTTSFTDESVGATKWDWLFGDGQSSLYASPSSTYRRPGEFDVTLTVTDANGCQDTITKPKLVFVGGPYGTFDITESGPFCVNDSTLFTAQTTNATVHEWDFGDGIVRDQAEMNAGHRYKGPGKYNVALVLYDANGCKVVADGKVVVELMDTTKIDFTFPSCIFTDVASAITATAEQNNILYEWVVDGQPAGSGQEISIALNAPGKHSVIVNATNAAGCVSTVVYDVPVQGDLEFIPNVFTPNGQDDLNSTFEILGLDRSTWDLSVYNRWGRQVYEKRTYNNDWTAPGLSTGVYYYLLKNAVCPERQYKGTVSIAR